MSPDQLKLRAYGRLSHLSDAEAEVYRYVEDGGARPVEVAGWTDREPTTVRTLLHRARRKLGEQPGLGGS